MGMTVRQALGLPALATGDPVVLSGEDRLDADLRWVHVSEVRDVGAVLAGHELVLTTGLGMTVSPEAAAAFVGQLVDAGAAGLVVELSAEYPAVPDAALRRARAAGLPVVALNRPVRFVDITEAVHRTLVAEQFEQVRFAGEVHRTFTDLGLARADTDRLVAAAAELAGTSVVLEDLARRVLAPAAVGEPVDRLLAEWERRSRLTPFLRATGTAGPERWLTTPVGIHGGPWGRLVALGVGGAGGAGGQLVDEARVRVVLERAAQALELARMVERDDIAIQLRVHGGFLLDLLDDRLGNEATAAARLRALGVPDEREYVGLAARLRRDAPTDVAAAQRRMVHLSERLHDAVRGAGTAGVVGVLDGEHVGVLLAGGAGLPDAVGRELRRREPDAVLAAGPVVDRVLAAGPSLRSARAVVDVAAALPPGDSRHEPVGCFRQSDIRLPGLLMSLRGDARLQEFAEAELGALLEHEARHPGGLVELLRQFLAVGGNKTELARVAHRNRTSLYPALRRLEDLVGHPLDDPSSRLSLGVALLAHDQGRSL
ncbi:PucR family transcriptional regulator [Nocardioides sp.]|uniref:PucR family transcriptional regulator n=1 Tax=Nocardioides sp. TaxID=35761 RepID=UPI0026126B69|nr:PucR family transcriptional regulator [Nocardioides sp.]MDI6910680.1 PucR family transcriptional regulator [Nocardioides sp.]